jgi:hypothetical protein
LVAQSHERPLARQHVKDDRGGAFGRSGHRRERFRRLVERQKLRFVQVGAGHRYTRDR